MFQRLYPHTTFCTVPPLKLVLRRNVGFSGCESNPQGGQKRQFSPRIGGKFWPACPPFGGHFACYWTTFVTSVTRGNTTNGPRAGVFGRLPPSGHPGDCSPSGHPSTGAHAHKSPPGPSVPRGTSTPEQVGAFPPVWDGFARARRAPRPKRSRTRRRPCSAQCVAPAKISGEQNHVAAAGPQSCPTESVLAIPRRRLNCREA
jgi:hypothetical protein